MFRKFRIAALSALLGLGTLAAMPASAQADGIYFSFGGNGARAGAYRDDYPRHHRRHHSRPHLERGCTPREAVYKARRMGLHRAHVVSESRSAIRVVGHRYRDHASIVFARAPNCPVIRHR